MIKEKSPVEANRGNFIKDANGDKYTTINPEMQEQTHESEAEISQYEHLRITDLTPIPEPQPLLTINGEMVATIEDIFIISGASKSGKSAFTNMLIAGAISPTGEILDGLEGVEILPNRQQKAVIHIDTEQSRYKQLTNIKGILKRANLTTCPAFFYSYNIRMLDIKDYKSTTSGIVREAFQDCAGIHSIWIDGGADYIKDVNDPETSNEIVKYFLDLAEQYHTTVTMIIHTNPGTPDKERGHFGSQSQRKTGGLLRIKTEGDISYIEPGYLRNAGKGDIPKLMFKYDKEKRYHVGCGILNQGIDAETKARNKIIETFEVCKNVFSGQRAYRYGESIEAIMRETAKSEAPAKGMFKTMKAHQMITQGTDEHWRINNKYVV